MLTNDTPIVMPEDDQFGVDPFARALAKALSEMPSPKGVVVAVNGPWGSGKSSAVNLVVFHLDELIKQEKLINDTGRLLHRGRHLLQKRCADEALGFLNLLDQILDGHGQVTICSLSAT
jgi:hypothetical protein